MKNERWVYKRKKERKDAFKEKKKERRKTEKVGE